MEIKWRKLNDKAIIPTKRDEDAGFDIYTTEDYIVLQPHEKHLFPTGIAAAIEPGYWLMGADRGSTGSKGIHIHCGVVDSGYRGEIFICLVNDNTFPVVFTSDINRITYDRDGDTCRLFYPTSKAIAQLIPIVQPVVHSSEVTSDEEWQQYCDTERGATKLGQSGK